MQRDRIALRLGIRRLLPVAALDSVNALCATESAAGRGS